MMKARILLIVALAVLCSTYALATSMPGGATSSSIQFGTVVHTKGPYGSHCDGDFGAGTGICYLYEDFKGETDIPYSILISPNNDVVTGVVGVFEPDGVTVSDALNFTFTPGLGTFVGVFSDPNVPPFIFNGTTNEAPCSPGNSDGCVALWSVGNRYILVSDVPEPSTIMLLGSGLFGAFCFVRRLT